MKVLEVALVVLCFAHVPIKALQDAGQSEYAILFDAGSTGTRMEIYRFLTSRLSLQLSDIIQLDPSLHKVKPGLDDLHDNPSQVEAYLTPLLESAKKTIPQDKQSSTLIYLLATAGMKLLPEDQANALLDEVRKLFNDKTKCPFLFEHDIDARIITGAGVGIYSWLTVNFMAGVFGTDRKPFGVLDLGETSHQNVWVFKSENNSDVQMVEAGGRMYSIFARTYLKYGQDQARETYLEYITKMENCDENPECVVKSPCHNKGFKGPLEFHGQERIFKGTAHVQLCRKIIRKLFFCHSPDLKKCPFSDQPELIGQFYGMSAIYYVLRDIGAVCSDCQNNVVTPRKIIRSAESYCGKDYDEIKGDPYAKNNCFSSVYIYELLTAGYKLHEYKKIRVANSLNGFDLSYTMGAILHNIGTLGDDKPS